MLVDPPGLTARSSTACHAPRTPARPSEGTLRPCGHCAKRLSHSVLRVNCLLSRCFNARIGLLRCLQTHLGVSFPLHAMPCPHSPRVLLRKALHVRSGHCATMDYPLFGKVRSLLRLWFCLRFFPVGDSVCVPKSAGFVRTPPIAQWGGCRPPHPPRDRDQAVLVCTVLSRRRRNDCHDKALGDSTVVLAPLNGPRVPSPSLTLYRRPRTTGLPTESTPALSHTRPVLPWRPLYRVPEISCRPCRPTKKLRFATF